MEGKKEGARQPGRKLAEVQEAGESAGSQAGVGWGWGAVIRSGILWVLGHEDL